VSVGPQYVTWLSTHCTSVLKFVLAEAIGCNFTDLDTKWESASPITRHQALRKLSGLLPSKIWNHMISRGIVSSAFLRENDGSEKSELKRYLEKYLSTKRRNKNTKLLNKNVPTKLSQEICLSHALTVARVSNQRRELPVDEGSWNRIDKASDVYHLFFKDILKEGLHIELPMVATLIPKGIDDYRLKAIPCNESLVLQQYILNELLVIRGAFYDDYIPAVRYSSQGIVTTGLDLPTSIIEQTGCVSFAYQINTAAISGDIPGHTGMFRPFYDCWKDFICYLDDGIESIEANRLRVERLDLRRFYDSLPIHSVRDVLLPRLTEGLKALEDPRECAPFFRPDLNDPSERSKELIDFFIEESFYYQYLDPSTGVPKRYDYADRGIPQGPDLSAYLANIALFPLDQVIAEYIHKINKETWAKKEKIHIRCARYIDDIVIISDSAKILSELKLIIESELNKLGLELNKKADPLPQMSKQDIRNWLKDARGGLGVSVGLELSSDTFDNLLNDSGLGGGISDRRDALKLLHSTDMYSPIVSETEIIASLIEILNCNEIRYDDICAVAEAIWRLIFRTDSWALEDFPKLWKDVTPQKPDQESLLCRNEIMLFVAIDGLDRVLYKRRDRNFTYTDIERSRLSSQRSNAAKLILKTNNHINTFVKIFGCDLQIIKKVKYSIELKMACCINHAVLLEPVSNATALQCVDVRTPYGLLLNATFI